jgi:exodeoxyribonuclease X
MKIFVIDTETTGLDPKEHCLVEVAALAVYQEGNGSWSIGDGMSSFVKPSRLIPPEASAIHHIVDSDVAYAPSPDEAVNKVVSFEPEEGNPIFCAHNAPFDRSFLPMLADAPWIDTCRCAKHMWPEAPAYGNQVLRYWLRPKLDLRAELGRRTMAHSALFDATVSAHILHRMLQERTTDDLLALSDKPVVLKKVGFGKHFGVLWTEVPMDYLQWATRQDFDQDVAFTIKTEIGNRQKRRSA